MGRTDVAINNACFLGSARVERVSAYSTFYFISASYCRIPSGQLWCSLIFRAATTAAAAAAVNSRSFSLEWTAETHTGRCKSWRPRCFSPDRRCCCHRLRRRRCASVTLFLLRSPSPLLRCQCCVCWWRVCWCCLRTSEFSSSLPN